MVSYGRESVGWGKLINQSPKLSAIIISIFTFDPLNKAIL